MCTTTWLDENDLPHRSACDILYGENRMALIQSKILVREFHCHLGSYCRAFIMKRTKHYLVTHIDPYLFPQPQDLEDKVLNGLGVWSATDVGDLEDKVKQYIHPYKVAHSNL